MATKFKLEIASQRGEADRGPGLPYRDSGKSEHLSALGLMCEVEGVAELRAGVTAKRVKNESTMEPTIDRSIRFSSKPSYQMYGGLPVTTYFEMLTVIGTTYTAFIAFLRVASPIIVQYMKNKNAPSIVIKRGETAIEVRNANDLQKAIDALEKMK